MRTIRINRKLCFAALFVGFVIFLVLRNTFKSYDQQILVQHTGNIAGHSSSFKHVGTKHSLGQTEPRFQANKVQIVAAVLVIACNRPEVKSCLDSLLKYRPFEEKFPIVVSQDCGHQETAQVITSYGKLVHFIKHPDLTDIIGVTENLKGYYKLSRHYRWALSQVFDVMDFDTVIIIEDDLEVSPDFFEYFEATKPLLKEDSSLWCVSAWNDNGKTGYVRGNDLLYRSDFFPGLGWMLKRTVWHELAPKWPAAFWDDWMRHADQRHKRACIRPEIPRVETFGRTGVSKGQFFDEHLRHIKLNSEFYPFTKRNLTFLLKDEYDPKFVNIVYKSPLVSFEDFNSGQGMPAPSVRIQYDTEQSFVALANQLGVMSDLKAGVPRMAYRGVVSFMYKGFRIYLAPPKNWKGYEFH